MPAPPSCARPSPPCSGVVSPQGPPRVSVAVQCFERHGGVLAPLWAISGKKLDCRCASFAQPKAVGLFEVEHVDADRRRDAGAMAASADPPHCQDMSNMPDYTIGARTQFPPQPSPLPPQS